MLLPVDGGVIFLRFQVGDDLRRPAQPRRQKLFQPGGALVRFAERHRIREQQVQLHQQALAGAVLADPAVASLSSFIGVDGTNTTLNSGRIQINLKPMAERGAGVHEVIRRLQAQAATVEGMSLYLQPMQDLTVEDRVSRTQYQYTLEDADPARAAKVRAMRARGVGVRKIARELGVGVGTVLRLTRMPSGSSSVQPVM